MTQFLTKVIGLEQGHRPPFPFNGAWFYSSGKPLVHVVEGLGAVADTGSIDHMALDGANYDELMASINQHGRQYYEMDVPLSGERQVFVSGPDRLTVEMIFPLGATSSIGGQAKPSTPNPPKLTEITR